MEGLKREHIVNVAMNVFKEKGYSSASMQDIAEACGMAKGSIYKIFPSKEDLFTAVFVACHQNMFDRASELDRAEWQEQPEPTEKLRRKIQFQLQYMLENYYFTIEFKELPIKDNENFISAWQRKRAMLLAWYRDCFLEAYGDGIETYIWDIVVIFRGMLKEYLFFVTQKAIALPMSELSRFLVERMDAVIHDMTRTRPRPVLTESSIGCPRPDRIEGEAGQATVEQFLQAFSAKIRELRKPESVRQELLDVIGMLREELEKERPNRTLVHVFAAYLEAVPELRPYVRQLTFLLAEAAGSRDKSLRQ